MTDRAIRWLTLMWLYRVSGHMTNEEYDRKVAIVRPKGTA